MAEVSEPLLCIKKIKEQIFREKLFEGLVWFALHAPFA